MQSFLLVLILIAGTAAHASDFVTIRHEISVERPADRAWQRIGDYCAIAEWLKVSCDYASGSGDVGTVRRLNGTTLEPMVARTAHSYTYWQSAGAMAGAAFHGTLAVEPDGIARSRISYTIVYDQAALPDARRAAERTRLEMRFVEPLATMKRLAEAQ